VAYLSRERLIAPNADQPFGNLSMTRKWTLSIENGNPRFECWQMTGVTLTALSILPAGCLEFLGPDVPQIRRKH
jgi:hypothetical protein